MWRSRNWSPRGSAGTISSTNGASCRCLPPSAPAGIAPFITRDHERQRPSGRIGSNHQGRGHQCGARSLRRPPRPAAASGSARPLGHLGAFFSGWWWLRSDAAPCRLSDAARSGFRRLARQGIAEKVIPALIGRFVASWRHKVKQLVVRPAACRSGRLRDFFSSPLRTP
jgi:hypothetical protein